MLLCPDDSVLARFLDGEGESDHLAALESHIDGCAGCQRALDRLTRSEVANTPVLSQMLLHGWGAVGPSDPGTPTLDRIAEWNPFANGRLGAGAAGPDDGSPHVPGYEILTELGRGGAAVVYKARHLALGREVALKMLLARSGGNGIAGGRFIQEAQTLARLRHPNIVQVFDIGEHAGRPFFSLELISGTSLARWLNGLPQPPRLAATIVRAAAIAVDYAHRNGVLHRDLKPGNLLIDTALDPPRALGADVALLVKVSDFGLAKVLDTVGTDPQTEPGVMVGTPQYMAPEQARLAGEAVGPAADVYALGVILYELLIGQPPFPSDSPLKTLYRVVHDAPPPVSRHRPRLSADLSTICAKCMEKDPGRRYPTAAALAEDLRRYLESEPILARPIGPIGRLTRWARRKPSLAVMVSIIAGTVLSAFVLVVWQWRVADDERDRAAKLATSEAGARTEAVEQRDGANRARQRAERLSAELLLDQGVRSCEQGDVHQGLRELALGLEQAVGAGLDDLEPAFRANLACWADRLVVPSKAPVFPSAVLSVAFSPDGKKLLVGLGAHSGRTGGVQLWNPDTWTPVGPELRHDAHVGAVAFSPDGTQILTGADDGTVRLWETATGHLIGAPIRELKRVRTVAFGPDGRTFAAGGTTIDRGASGEVRIWDAGTRKPVGPAVPHPGDVYSVAYSPDGKTLVTGCHSPPEGGQARQWDIATGRTVGQTMVHGAWITAVAFSPDGKLVMTASADHTVQLWDRAAGTRAGAPMIHPYPVTTAVFTPDGKAVLTGGGDEHQRGSEHDAGRLWDVATGQLLVGPLHHEVLVLSVAVSPDGRRLVTADEAGRVRLWPVGPWRPAVERSLPDRPGAIAFSPDGKWVVTGGGGQTGWSQVLEARTGRPVSQQKHAARVEAVAFSPDGRAHASLTRTGTARVWDAATGGPLGPALEHPQISPAIGDRPPGSNALTFTPDGASVLVSDMYGVNVLWDWKVGKIAWDRSSCDNKHATCLASLSPDGRTVLVGRTDGGAQLCDVATGRVLADYPRGPATVTAVAFGPDGRSVLVGRLDGSVRLGDATGTALIRAPGAVLDVGFSPDPSRICTVLLSAPTPESTVRLWDARTGQSIGGRLPHVVLFRTIAAHPRSRLLATGSFRGDVRLWDGLSGRPVGPPLWGAGLVTGVAFSPDGGAVATVGQVGFLRVWTIPPPVEGTPEDVMRWVRRLTANGP